MKSIIIKFIFFTVILSPSYIFALDILPVNDTFSSSSSNGYSVDDGDSDELQINKDKISQKIYDFSTLNKNKSVVVSFDIRYVGGWDDGGFFKDYFYVWFNSDTQVVKESFNGDGSKSYSFETTTDNLGKLRVKFKPDTTSSTEKIYIDNVKISLVSTVVDVDLALNSISSNPTIVAVDEDIIYTINISNTGADATDVKLNLSLDYSYFRSISSGWSCVDDNGLKCIKTDKMIDGDSENIDILLHSPSSSQTIPFSVSISSNENDLDISNNTLSSSMIVQEPINSANDICYVNDNPSFAGFMTNTSIKINNISGENLTDTEVFVDTSGFGSFMSDCSIDSGLSGDGCSNRSNYNFGPMSIFSKGTLYDLDDKLSSSNPNHTVDQSAMFDMSSLDAIYVKYTKNNHLYRMQMRSCDSGEPLDFSCAYPKTFEEIFNQNLYGKMLLIGNSSLCKNSNGICSDPLSSTNNDINMMNNDFDDDNATTVNSSGAYLDVPEGKEVVFAGLFWQGYMVGWSDTDKEKGRTIKYKHENDTYQLENNASMNWVYFDSNRFYYQGYKNITNYVKSKGGGYYWVGDIATTTGQPIGGSFGAWSLVVVYEDDTQEFKNITLFRGYQAFAGTTDINNAKSYAQMHNCSVSNTGVGNSVSSALSGFLTPKENDVNSTLAIFAGEGDIGLDGDSGFLTDENGVEHLLTNAKNPQNNIMNATISKNGESVTTLKPYISSNSLGIDIDTYDVSSILGNKQTSTQIKFTTSGDGYMPGMYGLETALYVPEFCYDYSYKQNNIYFTELNDGTKDPKITGGVSTNHPVEVGVYIKNKVESDITITNFSLDVYDINTTQMIYERESVKTTMPNSIMAEDVDDVYLKVADDYVKNIPIGYLDANEYFYFYYNLEPKMSTLDDPINIKASYDLSIGGESIAYELKLGKKIGLCTDNNFRYQPAKSIFNIVHKNYYDLDVGGSKSYYNLPTQVVNRAGNFKLIALKPDDLDALHNVSTIVAVDLVDLSSFHDSNASCQQLSSAVSERVWVVFDNVDSSNFDKTAIESAISDNLTNITDSKDFYKNAKQNTTFRITYNSSSNMADAIVELNKTGSLYQIENYQYWNDISNCMQDIDGNPATTNTTTDACTNGVDGLGENLNTAQLKNCMECLYGFQTKFICSRDNFAIRPEAFNVKLKDQNQTTFTNFKDLNSLDIQNLASGYKYNLEVNATSHTGSNSVSGYSYTLDADNGDIFGYSWEPRDSHDVSGCNDTNNSYINASFLNGHIELNTSLSQVGEYRFHILDKTWTSVDSNPSYMLHHTGAHFIPATTLDCKANSSAVSSSDPYSTELNGCYITSNHINLDASKTYSDYTITFHPYSFDISSIEPKTGSDDTALVDGSYIYMADISSNNGKDKAISFHLNGDIKAVDKENNPLSNFVDRCYAKDLTLKVDKSAITGDVAYRYRLTFFDNNGTILDVKEGDLNNSSDSIVIDSSKFKKDLNGSIKEELNLNFDRDASKAKNPESITFNKFDVTTTSSFKADLSSAKELKVSLPINKTLIHYYGRTHGTRQSIKENVGDVYINYEIYCYGDGCDKTLLPDGSSSRYSDDPRWFINTTHPSSLGKIGVLKQSRNRVDVTSSTPTTNAPSKATLTYNSASKKGYPYRTEMENNASKWLLYNKYDTNVTINYFNVEFYKESSSWAGKHETNTSTSKKGARRINRRSMW